MQVDAIEPYVELFMARCAAMAQPVVTSPGLHGVNSTVDRPRTRLMVTDDVAYEKLAELLPAVRAGTIDVFSVAPRSALLLDAHPAWIGQPATAMMQPDLRAVPTLPLPDGLTLRSVSRSAVDPPDAVPLREAAALAIRADASTTQTVDTLTDYLQALPASFELLAATDDDATVRATAGWGAFGAKASIIFINTDPGWRRRGMGQAMTTAALRAAYAAGCQQAGLDSSDAGLSIYEQAGFQTISVMTRFAHR